MNDSLPLKIQTVIATKAAIFAAFSVKKEIAACAGMTEHRISILTIINECNTI